MSRRARVVAALTVVVLALATGCPSSGARDTGTNRVDTPTGASTSTPGAEQRGADRDAEPDDSKATDAERDLDAGSDDSSAAAAGTWSGPATGGFKGDTITFTVTADGRLTDIVVEGYWRCDGSTELIDIGHFPHDVALEGDRFSATQRADYQLQWEIDGAFDGDLASGTVRIMSSTDCDTYELDWTATPQ